MASIVSYTSWPFVFLLWRNVFFSLSPIFLIFSFVDVVSELYELFVYFKN